MEDNEDLSLKFSHNIIEHLGLKLYQNKPTNVIAELISNSWDADSEEVAVQLPEDLNEGTISVADNGTGMDFETIQNQYLVIGKKKRSKQDIAATSPSGRPYMGRKGIGKLAPFGIAKTITVTSISKSTGRSLVNSFSLELDGIYSKLSDDANEIASYKPKILEKNTPLDSYAPVSNDQGLQHFLLMAKATEQGTYIQLESLTLKKRIPPESLSQSLGRRFTVTLTRHDFKVKINNSAITSEEALPNFDFRIPEKNHESTTLHINGKDREIRHWVGFVKNANWPQEEAGVGVYAHGKIAQDRPYFFKVKGREILTRYMYGVIEADWLDEFDEDIISTDRTTIDWEHDDASKLHEHCQKLVKQWIDQFKNWSSKQATEQIQEKVQENKAAAGVTPTERKAIADIVSGLGPKVFKDVEFQEQVIDQVTSAWTHRPMRMLVKNLWDSMDGHLESEELFLDTIQQLNEHLVPESLSAGVVVAQRAYALSKLDSLKMNGTEPQLQKLLECFPWIISPEMERLSSNQELKTTVDAGAQKGLIPSHGAQSNDIERDGCLRPDFIFFTNSENSEIIIVELKAPNVTLSFDHREQLAAYLTYIERHYPRAKRKGYLVGHADGTLKIQREDMEHINWNDLYINSRKQHIDLLMALLNGATKYASADDARIQDVVQFSGDATAELMHRLAVNNPDVKDLIASVEDKIMGIS